MDDLLREFLTETNESLDVVDVELVKFEQNPNDAQILDNIFRLVHTIKGTCGFLGLPRLEALAHAAETLMGKFRDGVPVTQNAVSLILSSIDRIKDILAELEAKEGQEPEGSDADLIGELEWMAENGDVGAVVAADASDDDFDADVAAIKVDQALERELRPGEVSLDELERAFRETEVELHPVEADMMDAEPAEAEAEAEDIAVDAPAAAKSDPAVERTEPEKKPVAKADSKGAVSNQSIRVHVETLEDLMTMVSELVLTRNQLLEIVRQHEDSEFKVPLQRLSNVTAELQEGVMKTRMQPIGNAWQKLPRIVRDLAQELDKKIELDMIGADTELDRQVLELIKDPLTHMVRNSADHGLEMPEDRRAAGKPPVGTIRLSAYHEGGHIIIEVADDGRGLHRDKITAKILGNGLATEDEVEAMTESQIFKYIFHAGFSTAANVTNVSGRGVGMDVVRTNIEQIGGTIDLRSATGLGTTVIIKIPLTLAIVSALIVEVAGDRFAIPQLSVVELVRVHKSSEHRIERIKETPVLRLRNKLLPLVHMTQMLGIEPARAASEEGAAEAGSDNGFIVVMQVGSQSFGIIVDGVFHTEEIVVKPMTSMLRNISMFSGNTILGDGSVIMIIDPNGIAQEISSKVAEDGAGEEDVEAAEGVESLSMLLFRAGSSEPKAVPLSLVTRLEEFKVDQIESSNGRDLVQYRGALMPLIYVSDTMRRRSEGTQPMLVFSDNDRSMGLVVDEIVDIVEDHLNIEIKSETPGLLGSAIIKGQATAVIDVGHFLPLAFPDWLQRNEAKTETVAKRLLYVDDSSFFRNMLSPVLKAAGFAVTTCGTADEALKLLEGGKNFDVIVTDIEMPGMDGFAFAETLRRDQRWRKLPIIAVSALCTPASIDKGRAAGLDDYVAKFDRPGLISALKDLTANEFGVAA